MTRYMPDGSPLSSAVPVAKKNEREHRQMFGIFRGIIVRAVYPDDPKNITKDRMEYVVKVRGQEYPNAICMREAGGIYNYQERVRKGIERSESNQITKGTYDELLDGEHVWVAFIEGYGNAPLILGGSEHPLHGKYKKLKSSDGLKEVKEFNGVEISIDKDGNYAIENVGLKNAEGAIQNPQGVGAKFTIQSDGTIEMNNGAKIKLSSDGILISDQFNNQIELKDGEINVTATGKMTAKGSTETDVGDPASPTKVDGQTVALAGGGLAVARINDMTVGTGNLGSPVISRIISGSMKVSSS